MSLEITKEEFYKIMLFWMEKLHQKFNRNGTHNDQALDDAYYDGLAGALKVNSYVGSSNAWYEKYVQQQFEAYTEYYVLPNQGRVQGYRNFTEGELKEVLSGLQYSEKALEAIKLQLVNGSYVATGDLSSVNLSRECAYAIMTHLNAQKTGIVLTDIQVKRLHQLVNWSTTHIEQWLKPTSVPYYRPFMGALTAKALIQYHQKYFLLGVKDLIKKLAQYTWDKCWKESAGTWGEGQAFLYTDRVTGSDELDGKTTPDLNLLIAPMYAWVTPDSVMATKIFNGGYPQYTKTGIHIKGAYLGSFQNPLGKHINQQMFWIDKFFEWLKPAAVQTEKEFLTSLKDSIQKRIDSL